MKQEIGGHQFLIAASFNQSNKFADVIPEKQKNRTVVFTLFFVASTTTAVTFVPLRKSINRHKTIVWDLVRVW